MFRRKSISLFQALPNEIKINILNQVPNNALIDTTYQLSCASKSFNKLFRPILINQAAKKLLQHILRNEKTLALRIIAARPEFIFIKSKAIDHVGRIVESSPYQAILGTTNVYLHEKVWPHITKIHDGPKLAGKQFKEQSLDYNKNQQLTYDFKKLADILTKEKFINKRINKETEEALKKFKNHFNSDLIKFGPYFNMQFLVNARLVYDEYFNKWKVNQKALYWKKVIGFLQRFLPVCHIEILCPNGNISDKNGREKPFFPLDPDLGEKFAVYKGEKSEWEWKLNQPDDWKTYIEKNNQEFEKIKSLLDFSPLNQSKKTSSQ